MQSSDEVQVYDPHIDGTPHIDGSGLADDKKIRCLIYIIVYMVHVPINVYCTLPESQNFEI